MSSKFEPKWPNHPEGAHRPRELPEENKDDELQTEYRLIKR